MTQQPKFNLRAAGREPEWEAVGYDAPWNGWATPIVTREVLEAVMDDSREDLEISGNTITWDGPVMRMEDPYDPECPTLVAPREDGFYHLVELGWIFDTSE